MSGTCDSRQLDQSQRTAGFSSPTGVQKAIRPFTGKATPENIVDYLNREQFPVIHAMRSKVNEVYLPSKLQAPSANPLGFVFDVRTASGDPGTGFVRLNASPQNTATVLTISQANARRKDVATWLSIMQGSVTSPLGVITISAQSNPDLFIRANLTSMVDQGAYWDLGISIVESSHNTPFVDQLPVQIGFIAGVATGGASIASTIAGIQGISAGASSISRGTLVFSNGSGVSFGLNGSTLTASVASSLTAIKVSAGTSSANLSAITLSNSNGVSFGLNGSTLTASTLLRIGAAAGGTFTLTSDWQPVNANSLFWTATALAGTVFLTGDYAAPRFVSAGASSATAGGLIFSNSNGISFGLNNGTLTASHATSLTAINLSAGTTSNNLSAFTVADSNGVSFGLNGSTLTASVSTGLQFIATNLAATLTQVRFGTAAGDNVVFSLGTGPSFNVGTFRATATMAVSAGTTSTGASSFVFSNSNNVSFGLNGATLTGSVASSLTAINISGGTTSQNLSALTFSNSNGVSFGLNGSVLTASVGAGGAAGSVSAGTTNVALGQVVFSNSNNMSWGLNGSTLTGQPFVKVSAGGASQDLSNIAFANQNNFSFGFNGASLTGKYAFNVNAGGSSVGATQLVFADNNAINWSLSTAGSLATISATAFLKFSAGTTSNTLSQLTFSDSNNLSWGLNGSVITGQPFFNVTGANGSSVNATVLAFTTGVNNVGFAVSTNASGATVRAAASISVSAGTTNVAASQLSFSNGNGVSFGLNGSTITGSVAAAAASINVSAGTTSNNLTAITFSNTPGAIGAAGISFGINGSVVTAIGRNAVIQASNTTGGASAVQLDIGVVNLTLRTSEGYRIDGRLSGSDIVMSYVEPSGGWNNGANPNIQGIPVSFLQNTPFIFCVSPQGVPLGGTGTANRVGDWHIGFFGSLNSLSSTVNSTVAGACGALAMTAKLGLYSVNGGGVSDQLNLVNSCSFTMSAASGTNVFQQLGNGRLLKFAESVFSVSSGFTRGEWYAGLLMSLATANDARVSFMGDTIGFGPIRYFGTVGQLGAANTRMLPMQGAYSITQSALPTGIGSGNLQAALTQSNISAWFPFVSVRPVMATGFR